MIRVLIADDHLVVREGLRTILEVADDIEPVGEAANGSEAVRLVGELAPDVVLLGVGTLCPDDLETIVQISERYPHSRVLMLSACDGGQERLALDAFRKGLWGYLIKGKSQPLEIIEAIRTVHRGGAILSPCVAGWILDEISGRQPRMINRESGQ